MKWNQYLKRENSNPILSFILPRSTAQYTIYLELISQNRLVFAKFFPYELFENSHEPSWAELFAQKSEPSLIRAEPRLGGNTTT